MKIQIIVNNIFRQNFKNHRVLGRVLFGISMLFLGLLNLFNVSSFAGYAPDYLPVPSLLVVLVGVVLTFAGFALFANVHVIRSSQLIALVFLSFIAIVNLPQGNMLELSQNVAFTGAALLISTLSREERSSED